VCGSMLQCVTVCCSVLQCIAVCCIVLQCVAACCSVLQFMNSSIILEFKYVCPIASCTELQHVAG